MRIVILFFLLTLKYALFSQCVSNNIVIPDEGTTSISFLISQAASNNLGQNNSLCEVKVKFTHEVVGDLNISLVSPAGQTLQLIGAGGSIANITDGTTWDISFISCAGFPNPDPGLSSTWDNAESWGVFQDYTGSYYPYGGCLEDFNQGTVNGTWTVILEDTDELDEGIIESLELIFCDDNLNCNICAPPVANPKNTKLELCEGSSINPNDLGFTISPPNANITNYAFNYVIFGKNKLLGYVPKTAINSLDTGNYKLCLLSYAKADSLSLPKNPNLRNEALLKNALINEGVCGILNGCINLTLLPVSDTIIRPVEICEGGSIVVSGITFDKEGSYFVTSTEGKCDSIINLKVDIVDLDVNLKTSKPILTCVDNQINITAELIENRNVTYKWSTLNGNILGPKNTSSINVNEPGKYYVELEYLNCKNIDSITISADISLPTVSLIGGIITCVEPLVDIKVMSNSIITQVNWSPIPAGFNGFDAVVNKSGDYTATVIDDKNCSVQKIITITENLIKPSLDFEIDSISCRLDSVSIIVKDSSNIRNIKWTGPQVSNDDVLLNSFTTPGNYNLNLTGFNGCKEDFNVNIEDARYTINVTVADDTINCLNRRVTLIPIADKSIDTVKWALKGSNNYIISNEFTTTLNGSYTVIAKDSNNCEGITEVSVEIDTLLPFVSVGNKTVDCLEDSVLLRPDSYVSTYQYMWSFGSFISGEDSIYTKIPGRYSLVVTDVNACTNRVFFDVLASSDLPDIYFKVDTLKCLLTTANITPDDTLGFDFKWLSTGLVNNTNDPFGVTNQAGNFDVQVTNRATGCKRIFDIEILDVRQIPLFTKAVDTIGCEKDSVQIRFTTSLPYSSLRWTGDNFNSNIEQPFVKKSGLFKLEIIDDFGCIFTDSIIVVQNKSIPTINTIGATLTCDPKGTKISAFSPDNLPSYTWFFNGSEIGKANEITVFKPGEYSVVVRNNRGCIDTALAAVVADTIRPSLGLQTYGNLNCSVRELAIKANANEPIVTYNFTGPGVVSQSGNTVKINQQGTYTLVATDASLCEGKLQFTVKDTSVYVKAVQKVINITCDSAGAVNLTLDLERDSIVWNGPTNVPQNSTLFESQKSGKYFYKIVSKEGCITNGEVDLGLDTISPKIIKIISDTISCDFPLAEIGINVGTSFEKVKWNDGFKDTTIVSVTKAGQYNGEVVGLNGCLSKFNVNVLEDVKKPSFTLKGDTIDCNNSKIDLELFTNESLKLIEWLSPDGKKLKGARVKIDKPGKYISTATGQNGCTEVDSIVIFDNLTKPTISLKDTFFIECNLAPVMLNVGSKDSLVTFRWVGIDKQFVSTDKNPLVNKTLRVKLFTAGFNGCNTVDSTVVALDTRKPIFKYENDTIKCNPSFAIIKALDVSDDRSVKWKGPNNTNTNTNDLSVKISGKYTLIVEGQNYCKDSVSIDVITDTIKPIVSILQLDSFYCDKKEVELQGLVSHNKYIDFAWSTKDGNYIDKGTLIANADKSGTYYFTVIDTFSNCESKDSIVLLYKKSGKLNFSIFTKDPICIGDKNGIVEVLNISGGFGKVSTQLNEEEPIDLLKLDNVGEGKYRIRIKDSLGCFKDTLITLKPGFLFNVDLSKDSLIELGQDFTLGFVTEPFLSQFGNISWTFNDSLVCTDCNPVIFEPLEDGLLKLLLEDEKGCKTSDSIYLQINTIPIVDFPNIISLNGNEDNRVYYIPNLPAIQKINKLFIYNPWGNIVHKSSDFDPGDRSAGWDGTFNGKKVNPGVFVVMIELLLKNGKIKNYTRTLTVVN